jgi:hypothetical protein
VREDIGVAPLVRLLAAPSVLSLLSHCVCVCLCVCVCVCVFTLHTCMHADHQELERVLFCAHKSLNPQP